MCNKSYIITNVNKSELVQFNLLYMFLEFCIISIFCLFKSSLFKIGGDIGLNVILQIVC